MRLFDFLLKPKEGPVEQGLRALERLMERGKLSGYHVSEQVCHQSRATWYAVHSQFVRSPYEDLGYLDRARAAFETAASQLKDVDISGFSERQKDHMKRMIFNIEYRVEKVSILNDPHLGPAAKIEKLDAYNTEIATHHYPQVAIPHTGRTV